MDCYRSLSKNVAIVRDKMLMLALSWVARLLACTQNVFSVMFRIMSFQKTGYFLILNEISRIFPFQILYFLMCSHLK